MCVRGGGGGGGGERVLLHPCGMGDAAQQSLSRCSSSQQFCLTSVCSSVCLLVLSEEGIDLLKSFTIRIQCSFCCLVLLQCMLNDIRSE